MLRPPAPLPSRHPSCPRCGGRWRRGRSLCRQHVCSAGWSECSRAPGAPFCETAPRLEPKPSAPPCRAPCSFYQERGDFLFPLFVENIPSAESGRAAVLRTRAAGKAPVARKPPRAAPALPALPGLGEPTASSRRSSAGDARSIIPHVGCVAREPAVRGVTSRTPASPQQG